MITAMLQEMNMCMKLVVGACIFCLVIGPTLIVMGSDKLTEKNHRADNVNAFNRAVAGYDANAFGVWSEELAGSAWVPTMAATALYSGVGRVTAVGNSDNVATAQTGFLSGSVASNAAGTTVALSLTITPEGHTGAPPAPVNLTIAGIAMTAATSRRVVCTSEQCSSGCSAQGFKCTRALLQAYCANALGGTYSDHRACTGGQECGVCRYKGNLVDACVPLKLGAAGAVTRSETIHSCVYPFGNAHTYGDPRTAAFTLTLVDERDPRIELSRITEGTNDFGPTAAEQRKAGWYMLLGGIVITACVFGGIAFLCVQRRKKQQRQALEQQPLQPQPQQQQQQYYVQETPPPTRQKQDV
jgi:hypothetical protein